MQPEGMSAPQPQNIPTVPPQPLPFSSAVTVGQFPHQEPDDEGKPRVTLKDFVLLFHSTPAGTAVCIWDIEKAKKIAVDIYSAANQAQSGIVMPDGSQSLQQMVRESLEKHLREKGETE